MWQLIVAVQNIYTDTLQRCLLEDGRWLFSWELEFAVPASPTTVGALVRERAIR